MSMFAENFEDLRIWQDARKLVQEVYKSFRFSTDHSFRNQIQSAAVSIMNNIAEGFGRKTKKDFAHFLDLAKGSAHEVKSMTYAGEDLQYLSPEDAMLLRDHSKKLISSIGALGSKLREQLSAQK